MASRTSMLRRSILALLCASLAMLTSQVARAQDEEDAERIEATREKLYQSLAREVTTLERQSNALKTVVKLVRPTVVHIEAQKTETAALHYGRKSLVEEAGSGCIVKINSADYILTNRHVIKAAKPANITILLADGRQIHPIRVWDDPETDIAVMSVNAPGLIAGRLGNSDEIEIGDFVLAVGSPFGLSHSITFGIVSATGRRDLDLAEGTIKFKEFIQTDAAINPGNSGGPLINLRGELVGMNTAIASNSGGNEGIGFSIPINMVMFVARQLVEHNGVTRGYLGVTLDRSFDPAKAQSVGLSRPRGARITNIVADSPAANAGLLKGDIVLQYDGVRIDNDLHLINLVGLTEVGREVPLVIFRDQKVAKLAVRLGRMPSNRAATGDKATPASK